MPPTQHRMNKRLQQSLLLNIGQMIPTNKTITHKEKCYAPKHVAWLRNCDECAVTSGGISEDESGTGGKEGKGWNNSRAAIAKQGCPKKPKVSPPHHSSTIPTKS